MTALRVAVASLALLACAPPAGTEPPAPRPRPTALSIRPEIAAALAEMQSEYTRETARCLTGWVEQGRRVVVTGIHPPEIVFRTLVSVRFRGCPSGSVGWWHNHPVGPCRPSSVDLASTASHRFAHVLVVSCRDGEVVYQLYGDPTVRPLPAPRTS